MVLTLMLVAREILDLHDYITLKHIDNMNKIILATGMIVGCAYAMEFSLRGMRQIPMSASCLSTVQQAIMRGRTG